MPPPPLRLGINTLFYLPGEVGGSETYLRETLRALARRSEPPQFVFFTNAENHDRLRTEFPAAELVFCGIAATNRYVRILAEQIRLPRLVKRAKVNVLWSPGYTAPAVCPCPQVVSVLDMQYKRFPEDVSWLAARTMDVVYPLSARRSQAVVAISEFAKSEAVRFLRIHPDKVTVTPLAADDAFRRPAGPPPADVQGAPYLLCVAHTYPHKNIPVLVRAFTRLSAEIPHHLVLVGKARRGEAAVAEAIAAAPPGRILRRTDCSHRELIALYQHADWFVFPSLYEGFGLPVLEAMCAGTPVLTTREAAIPEIAGDAVLYADGRNEDAFAATLHAALSLPASERQRLREAARARTTAFSWDASAEKLWHVFLRTAHRKNTS